MAVTWAMYSPDFAQWKCQVSPGRTMTLPGGWALTSDRLHVTQLRDSRYAYKSKGPAVMVVCPTSMRYPSGSRM